MKFNTSILRISVTLLALLFIGLFALHWFGFPEQDLPFIFPTSGDVRDVIAAKGTVGYRHQVSLRAGVSGRLERTALQEGDSVENYQSLFRIIDPQAKTEQMSRETTEERHDLHIKHLRRDITDLHRLVSAGATARQELESRQAELDIALNDKELARLDRKRLDTAQDRALVKSPFDGIVASLFVANGQWVNPGDELAVIAGGSQLQIIAQVEASEVSRISINQAVDFSDQPDNGQFRRGHVVSIGKVAQGAQQIGTVRVTIEPDGKFEGFRIGQTVYRECVSHEAKDVLRLPRGYVQLLNGRTIVLVLDGKRVVEREVLLIGGDRQVDQIAEGLTTSDRVVRGLSSARYQR